MNTITERMILRPDFKWSFSEGQVSLQNRDGFHFLLTKSEALLIYLASIGMSFDEIDSLVNETMSLHHVFSSQQVFNHMGHFLVSRSSFFEENPGSTHNFPCDLQKAFIENSFIKEDERKNYPRFISWRITQLCNLNCTYCYAKAIRKNPTSPSATRDIENTLIREASASAVKGFMLTGGDPLVKPNIYQIIKNVTDLDMRISFLTKNKIDFTELELINPSMLDIGLSIDTCNQRQADLLTGKKGYYDTIIYSAKQLRKRNIPFFFNITVIQPLLKEYYETVIKLAEFGPDYIKVNRFMNTGNSEIDVSFRLSDNEWEECIDTLQNISSKKGIRIITADSKSHKCVSGTVRMSVDENGNYIFCDVAFPNIHFGNVRSVHLLEAWNSSVIKNTVKNSGGCDEILFC